jgi:hypothetical protein
LLVRTDCTTYQTLSNVDSCLESYTVAECADAIWLEIHHELPELYESSTGADDTNEDYEYDITVCLSDFMSVTTHGYATVKLSECLTQQHRGISTYATIEIYGALLNRTRTLSAQYQKDDRVRTNGELVARMCPEAPTIFNATRSSSISPAIYRPSKAARKGTDMVSSFRTY